MAGLTTRPPSRRNVSAHQHHVTAISIEQRSASRIVGALYLVTMATAVFAEMFVRDWVIVAGNATATAERIQANPTWFRLGVISDLATGAGVVALTWGLFVVLRPVNERLALLGAFFRLVEAAVALTGIVGALVALRFLDSSPSFQAVALAERHALARLAIAGQGLATQIVFVLLGLGSTAFAIVWWQSRLIPRALAGLGIVGSALLVAGSIAGLLNPALVGVLGLTHMLPLGVFEVSLGVLLVIRRLPGAAVESANPH